MGKITANKKNPDLQQREIRSNNLKVEVRAVGENEGEGQKKIVGYAVKWGQRSLPIWNWFQEEFRKGAFANFLKRADADVIASWQHKFEEIIGRTTAGTLLVEEDDIGLRYEITPPSWAGRYIETIERGDVTGSSFIFKTIRSEWDESNPDMDIRTIIEAELIEVAPVTHPAYPQSEAEVESARSVYEAHKQELEAIKREKEAWKIPILQKKLDILSKI